MTTTSTDADLEAAEAQADAAAFERRTSPRSDLRQALGWIALGIVTTIGALNMDRLEKQDINPYTAPGLLPGLLGGVIVFFGLLLLYRSWRRLSGSTQVLHTRTAADRTEARRIGTVLALCIGFAAGLVGHGLPFWLATTLFVSVTIAILQFTERTAKNRRLRGFAFALAVGLGTGVATTFVFQELFLVHLP
ncbi:tripartite tricarboxylate transporter TctB family protein [Variovorax sp. RA8]|uniref:tripartite tricarboxylate transporter TctB family protein n=1 Tax=Variovorax sp. (strain JCM 16519 / RA8) TaxID=662548 RepID=UPI000A53C3B5|nr:tripartite tricarboxylate transporter TctB family protein [Variovorax sp. RA8]VTU31096.1 Tripartite tricarboxylate transporter TctB family protein [Variovorax sp. RA8]